MRGHCLFCGAGFVRSIGTCVESRHLILQFQSWPVRPQQAPEICGSFQTK